MNPPKISFMASFRLPPSKFLYNILLLPRLIPTQNILSSYEFQQQIPCYRLTSSWFPLSFMLTYLFVCLIL
ncbi:unnamed protein product [Brassica oleracea var. botrytis]